MKTEIKELNSTTAEFKVILEKNEVDQLYGKTVKYFRNKYAIPGFRKGKAPISMVKRMFKEAIDASFELAAYDQFLNEALIQAKQKPINEPELVSNKWLDNNEYEFTVKFEKMPEVDIKRYKDLEVEYIEEKFSDELVENQLQTLLAEYATKEQITENIQEHDHITLEFYKSKDSESPLFVLNDIHYHKQDFNDKFNTFIKSAKVGDMVETELVLDNIVSSLPDEYEPETVYFIKLTEAVRIKVPELNDDFAKDLNFDNLEALKKDIEKTIKEQIEQKNLESKITAVKMKIIEENPFDIPKHLIDKYSYELASSYVQDKNQIQQIIPMFASISEFNIKSYYIEKDIVKKENLDLTDQDIEEYNKKKAEEMHLDLDKYIELYKKTIETQTYKDRILEEKYNKFLLENNNFKPIEKKKENSEKAESPTENADNEDKKEEALKTEKSEQ